MPGYITGESADLFDPVTKKWVGVTDLLGREQIVNAFGAITQIGAYRAILMGDSLNANYSAATGVITAITVTNGIATATTSGNCFAFPGSYVVFSNVGDPLGNDEWSGKCVQVIANPADNQFTWTTGKANGTYTLVAGQAWTFKQTTLTRDGSFVPFLSAFLGGAINVIANYAIGGTVSDVTVAILPKILAGPTADLAFIEFGTNDAASATTNTTAQTISNTVINNYITCCEALIGAGITPVVGVTPFAGNPANTYFRNLCATLIRKGVLNYAERNPKVVVIDFQEAFADGTAANGDAAANTTFTDGLHPHAGGYLKAARIAAANPVLKRMAKAPTTIWIGDDGVTNTATGLTSIVQNPGFTGSGGVNAGNVITGNVPANWRLDANTMPATTGVSLTPATARTVPAGGNPNTANLMTCLAVALAPSANGQVFSLWSAQFPTKLVADRWYRGGFTILPTNGWTGIKQVQVRIFMSGTLAGRSAGTINQVQSWAQTFSNNDWPLLATDQPLTLSTDAFYLPPGAVVTSSILILDITASGAGAANFQLSEPFVIGGLSNPYV